MRNPLRILRARRHVITAAKLVESGYEPSLTRNPFDPDDLADLVTTVRELRRAETGDRQ